MSTNLHGPVAEDAIRIVPLQGVREARQTVVTIAPATPQLTYRGGPLLTAAKVVIVFWGARWAADLQDLSNRINAFFDDIVQSALIDQLAEYSVPNYTIGHGSRAGSATITDQEPPQSVSDSAIQQFLQAQIDAGHLPANDANTLYCVYLPPGVAVSQGGGQSCLSFCGYHNSTSSGLYYAVLPSPDCTGCLGSLASFAAITSISSHELCEAITDPVPGQGWYDDYNGEIGDICAWQTKVVDGYTVQLEWSNQRNACV